MMAASEEHPPQTTPDAIGRCVFCIYETRFATYDKAQLSAIKLATKTIETPRGPRDVCDGHASIGRWRG